MLTRRWQLQRGGSLGPLSPFSKHTALPQISPTALLLWKCEFNIVGRKQCLKTPKCHMNWFNYFQRLENVAFQFNITQVDSLNLFYIFIYFVINVFNVNISWFWIRCSFYHTASGCPYTRAKKKTHNASLFLYHSVPPHPELLSKTQSEMIF